MNKSKNIINMCLFTKQLMPIRARRDITVYKRLYRGIGKYFTPLQRHPVLLNSTLAAEETDVFLPHSTFREFNGVSIGFIHAHTMLEDAISNICFANECIVECTIKKDTLYYISYDRREICAKSVEVHDIVVWRDLDGHIHIKK